MARDRLWRPRAASLVAGLAAVGLLASGCGDDTGDGPTGDGPGGAGASSMDGMDGMDGMAMHDPDATPAHELPDATEVSFVLLDTAPPGSDEVAGTAWVAFGDDPGTTLTVTLTGLEPGAAYVGHLHADPCADGSGGPHFRFDPDGSDMPPNEVHIGFTADASGAGSATITNSQAADEAASVVIHPVEAIDNRLVCADL